MNVIAELEEIGRYFAERSDVRDGSYGEQIPNIEMRLEWATKDLQRLLAELIEAVRAYDKDDSEENGDRVAAILECIA